MMDSVHMDALSKILPLFVLPLGCSLILLLWGLARRRRGPLVAGVIVLLVSSNPLVGRSLIRVTEGWAERKPAASVGQADAVVVLSAGRTAAPGPEQVSEWRDANRFFGGVELFLAGKAPLLVFTGAWTSSDPALPREGEVLAAQAKALNVPPEQILVTGDVANTADEAREVAALLKPRVARAPRVLLVTSAFHMPRARQVFEQAGVIVDPFPVSFSGSGSRLALTSVLPSVSALSQTQTALRELYGRAFYWLRNTLS
jgi:uncharacterized SAM-binding protein YcdF (DUF218 family)